MNKLLCLIMMLIIIAATGCDRKDKPVPASSGGSVQNKAATDITVTSLDGNKVKLSDLKGKVVLLNFWATWCPPCREEIPSMSNLNKLMAGKPFQMLAVSIDEGGKTDVEKFFKSSGFSLPAYLDQNRKAAEVYGITGVPETFIIDKKGMIVKTIIGPLKWDDAEAVAFINDLMK